MNIIDYIKNIQIGGEIQYRDDSVSDEAIKYIISEKLFLNYRFMDRYKLSYSEHIIHFIYDKLTNIKDKILFHNKYRAYLCNISLNEAIMFLSFDDSVILEFDIDYIFENMDTDNIKNFIIICFKRKIYNKYNKILYKCENELFDFYLEHKKKYKIRNKIDKKFINYLNNFSDLKRKAYLNSCGEKELDLIISKITKLKI